MCEVGVALLIGAAIGLACGPGATPATGKTRVTVIAPTFAQADFAVSPAELGDTDVWARIRHRARVARVGHASFAVGGPHIDEHETPVSNVHMPIYPVIGESSEHVRVVVEDDFARMALWIPRADCAPTAIAPVRLGDAHGTADPATGVTLDVGARLIAQPAANGLRQIALVDAYLDATGFAPARAIGEVWLAAEHEVYDPKLATSSEPVPTTTGTEVAAGPIREAPRDAAAVVAVAKQPLPIRVIRTLGPWDEIELRAERVRVRGFVPAPTVTVNAPPRSFGGYGRGGGYSISDSVVFDVADGACLYDREGGDVVGVEVGQKSRYAGGATSMTGWWNVVVNTDWGLMTVAVHDTSEAANPRAASWETCKK